MQNRCGFCNFNSIGEDLLVSLKGNIMDKNLLCIY